MGDANVRQRLYPANTGPPDLRNARCEPDIRRLGMSYGCSRAAGHWASFAQYAVSIERGGCSCDTGVRDDEAGSWRFLEQSICTEWPLRC